MRDYGNSNSPSRAPRCSCKPLNSMAIRKARPVGRAFYLEHDNETVSWTYDFEQLSRVDPLSRSPGRCPKYARHPEHTGAVPYVGHHARGHTAGVPHRQRALPQQLHDLIANPDVIFQAHNAEFEFCIWRHVMQRRYGAPNTPLRRFQCTAARAAAAGLRRALDKVGAALRLDIVKDKEALDCSTSLPSCNRPANLRRKPRRHPAPPHHAVEHYLTSSKKLLDYNRTDVRATWR